jgi:hypothetical protein
MIQAGITDLAVHYRDLVPRLDPVRRTFLLAGQSPLSPCQLPLPGLLEPRVSDELAVRGDYQAIQAQIYAYLVPTDGHRNKLALDDERCVVAAIRITEHGDTRRLRWERSGPADPNLTYLRHIEPPTAQREPVAS